MKNEKAIINWEQDILYGR